MKWSSGKIRIGAISIVGVAAFAIGAVAALTVSQAQLATSPWPAFRHDLSNTGLSQYDTSGNIGQSRWSFEGSGGTTPVIGVDGTIYVGGDDSNLNAELRAVNPDGTLKWKFAPGPGKGKYSAIASSPAIGADGTIYVGVSEYSGNGGLPSNLYALTPAGSPKWKFATGSIVTSSPTVGTDGTIYVGSDDANFYAVNPDGMLKWKLATNQDAFTPAIAANGTIYVCDELGKFYALKPDGTLFWEVPPGQEGYGCQFAAPAIGPDGTIYFTQGSPTTLVAFEPTNGTVKWIVFLGSGDLGRAVGSTPAIGADGTIYLAGEPQGLNSPGFIEAVNPGGTEKWLLTIPSDGFESSASIGADGTIYVGSNNDNLYAVNSDGTLKWMFTTGGDAEIFGSPAIGADGTIYVGSNDGRLYAVGIPSPTPTATATPTATPTPILEKLTITPGSLTFGRKTTVGKTSKAKTVTIKNAGSKKTGPPINVEMESALPSVFAVKSKCKKTLAPGKSCKASVTFKPMDNTTAETGSLMIFDDATGSPQSVRLFGMGKAPK
jgi:outer membrane protein assembly factor BamB